MAREKNQTEKTSEPQQGYQAQEGKKLDLTSAASGQGRDPVRAGGSGFAGPGPAEAGLTRREEVGRGLTPSTVVSPFSFMRRMTDEMDRLLSDLGFGFGPLLGTPGRELSPRGEWSPAVEVFERDNKLVVRADVPGLSREDITVEIDDDRLILHGERKEEQERSEAGFYHSERSYGSFYRAIPLPEGVNSETVLASFNNGVLEIEVDLPAQEQQRGRKVEIRDGSLH